MTETGLSLSGLLDRAMRRDEPTLLQLGGAGSIAVYPRQQCYVSDVADWTALFTLTGLSYSEAPAMHQPPPEQAQPLMELHWRTSYHRILSEGTPEAVTWDLFQLVSWPHLNRLPDELVEPVTRICALLWRKPTVGFLVSRVLLIPAPQTLAVLALLREQGHVVSPRSGQRPAGASAVGSPSTQFHDSAAEYPPDAPAPHAGSAKPSIVGKLWRRLMGGH